MKRLCALNLQQLGLPSIRLSVSTAARRLRCQPPKEGRVRAAVSCRCKRAAARWVPTCREREPAAPVPHHQPRPCRPPRHRPPSRSHPAAILESNTIAAAHSDALKEEMGRCTRDELRGRDPKANTFIRILAARAAGARAPSSAVPLTASQPPAAVPERTSVSGTCPLPAVCCPTARSCALEECWRAIDRCSRLGHCSAHRRGVCAAGAPLARLLGGAVPHGHHLVRGPSVPTRAHRQPDRQRRTRMAEPAPTVASANVADAHR